jgi:4a-hydroxytetrahydrobiopterin dehydratase
MTEEEIQDKFKELKDWRRNNSTIQKEFQFNDFREAFAFMTSVALFAEKIDHHPDWSNSWNKVTVSLTTHDKKSLTSKDFQLAKLLDSIIRTH